MLDSLLKLHLKDTQLSEWEKHFLSEWIHFLKAETYELVTEILEAHMSKRALILDFDETFTLSWTSSFEIAYNLTSKEGKKKFDEIHIPSYKKYKEWNLSKQWYIDWHYIPLKVLEDEWINNTELLMSKIKETKLMEAKEWIIEFFELAYKNNIPIVFVSAWVWNVIEAFLELHWINFPNISVEANFIWEWRLNRDKIIYWENKWEITLSRQSLKLLDWKTHIIHGWDSLNDLKIWHLINQKKKLSILFFNEVKAHHYNWIDSDILYRSNNLHFLKSFVN